ncbi:MAG: hypothetical protein MJ252_21090 [archaeon]|nr:hypothetical protein [archaeon]
MKKNTMNEFKENFKTYFKNRILDINNENAQMKSDLINPMEEENRNSVEYYMKINNDLMTEISTLKRQKELEDNYNRIEKEKLSKENEEINLQNFEVSEENINLKAEIEKLKLELVAKEDQIKEMSKNLMNSTNIKLPTQQHTLASSAALTPGNLKTISPLESSERNKTNSPIKVENNINSNSEQITEKKKSKLNTEEDEENPRFIVENENSIPDLPPTSNNQTENPRKRNNEEIPNENEGLHTTNKEIGVTDVPIKEINFDYDSMDGLDKINELSEANDKLDKALEENRNLKEELTKKDFIITDLQNQLDNLTTQLNNSKTDMKNECESWKKKFMSAVNVNKTLATDFENLYNKKISNFKADKEKTIYEMEKKLINMEKLLTAKETELNSMIQSQSENLISKDKEVSLIETQLKNVESTLQLLYETYTVNLSKLTENLNKMKELYFTREKEFINITKYYIDMVGEYSKPIREYQSQKSQYELKIRNNIEKTNELEKMIEDKTNELNSLTFENINMQPQLRLKINQALEDYEGKIDGILENVNKIGGKFEQIESFVGRMEKQLSIVTSILEDNKKLTEKCNSLQCKIRSTEEPDKLHEVFNLKEQVLKLKQENELKSSALKDYEIAFSQVEEKLKKGNKGINQYDTVSLKLNNEIIKLNNQILGLEKSKEGIENFYKDQVRKLIDQIKLANEQIDQLKTLVAKLENDVIGKKDTILDLFNAEFKEFRANLLSFEEIFEVASNFKIEGDELLKHKEYLCNEELMLLRNELKNKEDLTEKNTVLYKNEVERYKKLFDDFNASIKDELETLQKLTERRNAEIEAVEKEKEALKYFEETKAQLVENEKEAWEREKEDLEKLCLDQTDMKENVIAKLKDDIIILEEKIKDLNERYGKNVGRLGDSMNEQLKIIKDREDFTLKQLDRVTEQFENYKTEKEMTIRIMEKEIDQLKNINNMVGANRK